MVTIMPINMVKISSVNLEDIQVIAIVNKNRVVRKDTLTLVVWGV